VPAEQGSHLIDALKRVAAILRDGDVEFALGGGLAAWARGGPPTEHDVDLVLCESDADPALRLLDEQELPTERPPEGWLVKTWIDGVLVDLIYRPAGLTIDHDYLSSCDEMSVAAVRMRVMPVQDIFVTKLLALTEHDLDFESLLVHARSLREQIDWSRLAIRVRSSPFARAFLTLAHDLDSASSGGDELGPGLRSTA